MISKLITRLHAYRFDWKLSLLTAVLLPLMISLGFWQLRRGDEKDAIQRVFDLRVRERPVNLAELETDTDLQYKQVALVGHFDNAHVFLLDNRVYQGRPGFEVIVPFVTSDERVVMVNRGWVAMGPSRTELPQITAIEGEQHLRGAVYQAVGQAVTLGTLQESQTWPRVIETLDVTEMAAMAGVSARNVFPHSVRLGEGETGVLIRYWPVISMSPEKHRGYAVQWFAMSLALLLLYLYYSTKPQQHSDASEDI